MREEVVDVGEGLLERLLRRQPGTELTVLVTALALAGSASTTAGAAKAARERNAREPPLVGIYVVLPLFSLARDLGVSARCAAP